MASTAALVAAAWRRLLLSRQFRPQLLSTYFHTFARRPRITGIVTLPTRFHLDFRRTFSSRFGSLRNYSSDRHSKEGEEGRSEEEEEESEGDDDEDGYSDEEGEEDVGVVSRNMRESGKTEAEKVEEAAEIGYQVVGPLDTTTENPFKPYEPVFAVVQIGSHQFKVSNGDSIFTERLKFCQVNDKLILNKVLMLGSTSQTMIGRPTLSDVAVHAVVEEHALDAKVIIFKKKRRKNYRRTRGHRQELTKLRIIDIQGIEKPKNVAVAV